MAGPVRNPNEAFQQLESIMLKQMLQSSGAFRAGTAPGSQLRTDLFVETLADAVAKAGGLGIAHMLERQLGEGASAGAASAASAANPASSRSMAAARTDDHFSRSTATSLASVGLAMGRPNGGAAVDDLDDPNSEAPLPEDPRSASIDDYQPPSAWRRPLIRQTGHAEVGGQPPTNEVTDHITSPFGPRLHPLRGGVRFHTGVDLRANAGAPIRAAADGVVREAGPRGGYGNAVEIDHGNGTSTLYAHASALLVDPGQRVEAGQPVALVGSTGQATGPHLHFELRRHDHPVDPAAASVPGSVTRALNRYRERAEVSSAGTPTGAGNGSKP